MSRAQYFHSIDNVPGAYEKRFFGAGFRRVRQLLNNIFIHNLDGKGVIGGQASIHYPVLIQMIPRWPGVLKACGCCR